MSGGRVLVTGANGHIGNNVVRALIAAGYTPVAFVRRGADLRGIERLDLERIEGDILDPASLRRAVQGCRFVLHLAAVYRTRVDDPDEVMRPAVEGSENVLEAAADAGVERFVFTSSAAAVGSADTPDSPRDERHWNEDRTLPYGWAKTVAERRTWELAASLGTEAVAINPTGVLGDYDYRITPTTRYLLALLDGTAQTGRGGFNYTDVRDVATAHVRALTEGMPGERYIVAGVNTTLLDLGRTLHALTGIGIAHIPVPRWAAMPIVRVLAGFSGLLGREPAVTLTEARSSVDRYSFFDGSRATVAFDLPPRKLDDILDRTIRWLVFVGALQRRTLQRLGDRFAPDESWRP